jgi:YD repeat-containing protein
LEWLTKKEGFLNTDSFAYDALNRLTKTTGLWGYKEHTYEYDSLGNLLYEKNANGTKKGNEYWYKHNPFVIANLIRNLKITLTMEGCGSSL